MLGGGLERVPVRRRLSVVLIGLADWPDGLS